MTEPQETTAEDERGAPWWRSHDLAVTVILSITAILTAWTAFQSSKWSGAMSIAFSQASSARIESSTQTGTANARTTIDDSLFTSWVEATARDDTRVAEFYETRFTPQLATAFDAWIATDPIDNPDAPNSPFAMDEYVPPGEREAQAASDRADAKFQEALDNNQRGDNYTLLTVLFASVLFFVAMSSRLGTVQARWGLLGAGTVLFVVGAVLLSTFPKLI